LLESLALQALELDADSEVIAVVALSVKRCPSMPSPIVTADKLPQSTITPDKKMG
jgi:hypothetical protein